MLIFDQTKFYIFATSSNFFSSLKDYASENMEVKYLNISLQYSLLFMLIYIPLSMHKCAFEIDRIDVI